MTSARYQTMPFDEAISFFKAKINLPSERWDDLSGSQHDAAFVVAGVKGALLSDVKKLVERALEDGKTLETFKADFDRLATVQGWKPRQGIAFRQEIIYRTNLRMAHAAGRYAQQLDPEVLKIQPYLRYIHSDSTSPRPAHLALDGLVFRAMELPFFPPSGYGCSCRVISLTQRQLDEQGLEVSELKRGDLADYKDERGQTRQAKLEPAPGFDYIPTQPSAERRQGIIAQIIARSPEPLASQMQEEAAKIDAAFASRQSRLSRADQAQIQPALLNWVADLQAIEQSGLDDETLEKLLDAEFVSSEMAETATEKLRGVVDSTGELQAAASVFNATDHLYLEYITKSPANLEILGAAIAPQSAKALMSLLIKESIDLGFEGRIELTALEGSRQAYLDMGFGRGRRGRLELSPAAAQQFLEQHQETVEFMQSSFEEYMVVPDEAALERLKAFKKRRMAEIKAQRNQSQTDNATRSDGQHQDSD